MNLDERNDYPLVYVLKCRNAGLADQAARLIRESPRILEYSLSTFPGGTDHTQRHTRMVEKIGLMMLSDAFLAAMTDEELFFLAVACHYHDLAMAGTEADDKTPQTREQVRRDHAVRIGDIVREKWAELGFENPRLAHVLGEVCRGHRPKKNAEGVVNWDELKQTEVLGPGVAVRVRLLSALIYAIDELHLGADRAPERVQNWRNIHDEESRRHWRRHQAVNGPVSHPPTSLLFQVSADTPEFEENLRSQVFRKAFSALNDLRQQATADGVTATLPSITIQWERQTTWELLLIVVCDDMKPRSQEEIVQAILGRFRQDTAERIELEGVCTELGNTESELVANVGRAVHDAVTKNHLVIDPRSASGFVLSTAGTNADTFFERTRQADNLDLLFVGRYRDSWEQELFASEFGRGYVRSSVFPVVERTYSVRLTQRPVTDPIRVLLELCPSAARLVRDHAPQASNLVKESLLAQATVTGALIDLHSDPERLLDGSVRTAIRALTAKNETVAPTVRLLEELALVGGFTHDQVSAAACPSEAAQEVIQERHHTTDAPIRIHLTQSLPPEAAGTTHLTRLLLASQRAGTQIFLTTATDHSLNLQVEADNELANRDTTGFVLGIGPSISAGEASFRLPARLEVSRTTRTVRLYLGQFSANAPTAYPVIVTLPPPLASRQRSRANFSSSIQWPELTVRDMRTLEVANQVIRHSRARIELIIESNDRVLGSMGNPQGGRLFALGNDDSNIQRGLRGLESALPAPVLVAPDTIAEIGLMTTSDRALRWQEERNSSSTQQPRVSSVFLRMTTSDGRPFEERFLRFLPFEFFPAPTLESYGTMTPEEMTRQWNKGENDFLITGFFGPDVHELARELRNWCQNPRDEFPFSFNSSSTPDPITRSMMTVRLLRSRDRVWHRDRPIIFEFRPVNRREAYQYEAQYWKAIGDERRAQLAQEICDREAEKGDSKGSGDSKGDSKGSDPEAGPD